VKQQLLKNAQEHAAFQARIAALETQMLNKPAAQRRDTTAHKELELPATEPDGALAQYEKKLTPFQKGFFASFAMIILSELGDKTFFIAAILAMRHPRFIVFSGAIGALALMTVLSAGMGYAAPLLLPHQVTHYLGALLFLYFGVQLIREASGAEGGVSGELAETEEELYQKDGDEESGPLDNDPDKKDRRNPLAVLASPILIKTFTLTFVAEWGDRSQIATIALAAAKDVYGVTLGGIIGHAICTAIAVIGGKLLAERISERTMLYLGGCVFLMFGLIDLIFVEA
jgi:putative Ca2+/H+ antiporter (TMEM165/GDT1 family)